jgi:hypothetical protein
MPLDRTRIEYFLEDLKSRPDRMALVKRSSAFAGIVLLGLLVLLLARGSPPKKPPPKPSNAVAPTQQSQGVLDAFAMAKAAEPVLRTNPRFSRVYFVPSAATPAQKYGKIVVQGEMASEADVNALQLELVKLGVTVPIEWQVSISSPSVH